jgi:hypothetical protein
MDPDLTLKREAHWDSAGRQDVQSFGGSKQAVDKARYVRDLLEIVENEQ